MLFEIQVRKLEENNNGMNLASFVDEAIEIFLNINETNYWEIFRLARMCVRYVYFDKANQLFENMTNLMSSVNFNMSANDLR